MKKLHVPITIANIKYVPANFIRQNDDTASIEVIGIDTEAFDTGKCFMITTSLEDVYLPKDFPACFFTRKYRGAKFVAYNLKYDSGAFLQHLPLENLKELQTENKTEYQEYTYKVIANKMFTITKGKNSIHIYDMLNFYNMSLDNAAKQFLGEQKIDIETKTFTEQYVRDNWVKIAEYCIHDSVLVKRLADRIIRKFEEFGVYPKRLYSVAYISNQYFNNRCPYIHVKKYWYKIPELIDYAMQSYNGGKFEVTRKGPGKYYEYDIVSAYPFEMSNLVDIRRASVSRQRKYIKDAAYGFINCTMKIPVNVYSPIAMKRGQLNYYPVGTFTKVITKTEYEYLISIGVDITIHKAYWLNIERHQYPYRTAIYDLMEWKDKYKREGLKLDYHTVKIILNSRYGKMVQLIYKDGYYKAGSSWNPIYGSIITANCRIRVSQMQQEHKSIVAVHTDSIISTKSLKIDTGSELGMWEKSVEGEGVILGSGIYQIGTKSKFRGFDTKRPLIDMLPVKGQYIKTNVTRPHTWREVAHRGMDLDMINKFETIPRKLHVNFDCKRIWLDDYKHFGEARKRSVESVAWPIELEKLLS